MPTNVVTKKFAHRRETAHGLILRGMDVRSWDVVRPGANAFWATVITETVEIQEFGIRMNSNVLTSGRFQSVELPPPQQRQRPRETLVTVTQLVTRMVTFKKLNVLETSVNVGMDGDGECRAWSL